MGIDARFFCRANYTITEEEVRQLSYRLSEAVGPEWLCICRPDSKAVTEYGCEPHHALEILDEPYYQDGPEIYPGEGEALVMCYVNMRYYGPGYERGPWPILRAIGEWLEYNVGPTYYGGDSSGVLAERWTDVRAINDRHWLTHGSIPYSHRPDNEYDAHCDFCNQPMSRCGRGPKYAAYVCLGCGKKQETRDGGKTWNDKECP